MGLLSWWKRRLDLDQDDFRDEVQSHLAIAARERTAGGADAESARLDALKEFGNLTLTAEAARRVWRPRWLEVLQDYAEDVRYAVRVLAKNPVFALTVIAVLTLGIGLNAAVFTMLKSMALTPLAGVQGSAQLGVMYAQTSTGRDVRLSYADYRYIRDHDRAFSGLLASGIVVANLGRGPGARQVFTELVSGNYFAVLGVRAQLGRTLQPSDEQAPGRHPVVVISDALWRRDFSADPGIVGRTVEVNNQLLTVVGVTDPSFHGTIVSYDVELFVPVMMAPQLGFNFGSVHAAPSPAILGDRRAGFLYVIGRFREGVTLASASAQAEALWSTLSRERPLAEATPQIRLVPFWRSPSGGQLFILPTLVVLSLMGLLVLLIACANIAGLVLVRGLSRRGELGVRLALGASRSRIVRLLVLENLVIAMPGALLGVVLANRSIPVLVGYAEWLAAPERIFFNIGADVVVIGFAAAVGALSALVFGLVPALQSSRIDLVSVINEDASTRGAARGRMRAALVVAQVAVSMLLLVGSGLATRSVDAARRTHPGFEREHVTSVGFDLKLNGYDEARGRAFYRKLLGAAQSEPGVESATLAAFNPLGLLDTRPQRVEIGGYVPRKDEDLFFMSNTVAPDYFRTLRIPVRAGRPFEFRDDEAGAPVAVVNHTLAQRFWGGAENALGKRIRVGEVTWRTVVGVAADIKYSRIDEGPRPYVYVPLLQAYRSSMVLHTRGTAPDPELVEQARRLVSKLDPELPVLYARPMTEMMHGAFIFLDLTATMLFVFGAAGMALAALGTYGLVSYSVRQSTREIGIRMALGASRSSVVRAFLERGLRLGAAGAALGVVGALGAAKLLSTQLFGVSATDAVSFASALAVVLAGVVLATVFPAWRASRTNPVRALRHQ